MHTLFRFILALMLLATISTAVAQDEYRWTVSAHAGNVDLDMVTRGSAGGAGAPFWGRIDDDRSHLGVSLTFDAMHWLGVRAMFERATGFDMVNRCPPGVACPLVALHDRADLDSWTLAALPRYQIHDEVSIYGIVGAQYWDVSTGGVLPGDSGTEFAVGAGVGWRPTPQLELGLEYQHANLDFNAWRFNIGVRF
jgi:opacity protein-like surface antigen